LKLSCVWNYKARHSPVKAQLLEILIYEQMNWKKLPCYQTFWISSIFLAIFSTCLSRIQVEDNNDLRKFPSNSLKHFVLFELVAYAEFKLDNNVTHIHFKYCNIRTWYSLWSWLFPWESYVVWLEQFFSSLFLKLCSKYYFHLPLSWYPWIFATSLQKLNSTSNLKLCW